jgi:hypothetical protein
VLTILPNPTARANATFSGLGFSTAMAILPLPHDPTLWACRRCSTLTERGVASTGGPMSTSPRWASVDWPKVPAHEGQVHGVALHSRTLGPWTAPCNPETRPRSPTTDSTMTPVIRVLR